MVGLAIDPEVFFRIYILGHIYRISFDRQLCDEIQVNVDYRWFVGLSFDNNIPDHSSMTKVGDQLGKECFQKVFEKIVDQCHKSQFDSRKKNVY